MVFKFTIAVFGLILTTLISYGVYKYNSLNNIIAEKDKQIRDLLAEEKILNAEIIVLKSNEDTLKQSLKDQNEKLSKLAIENEANLKKFHEWRNKANNEKYKNSKLNSLLTEAKAKTCEDGININKSISSLRYEDL